MDKKKKRAGFLHTGGRKGEKERGYERRTDGRRKIEYVTKKDGKK